MKTSLRLVCLLRQEWGLALAGIALSAGVMLANTSLLALSGWFIAAMALAGHGSMTLDFFAPAAAIRALAILRAGGRYLERLVTHDVTFRLLSRLRVWAYERLEPLAPAVLQQHRRGDVLSRLRADIDRLETAYLRVLTPSAAAFLAIPPLLGFLAWLCLPIAIFNLAGLMLTGIVIPIVAQRIGARPGAELATLRGLRAATLVERLRGFEELLVDGALPTRLARNTEIETSLRAAQLRQGWGGWISTALAQLAAQLCLWAVLLLALPRAAMGLLSGPDVAMLALLVLASFETVGGLPAAYQALGETIAAAQRVFELTDSQPVLKDPTTPAPSPTHFLVQARNLTMRYGTNAAPVFKSLNFTLPEGECLGIVGPSGAGKTTLLNIMLRFWDYESGALNIGGVELKALPAETMRRLCAVVAQQTHLFNTSIRENLLVAKPDASDDELREALRKAALLDEVSDFLAGLDTLVGEAGRSLSGGQARRLSIARAFLKDAPLLLLDEPTEGLDTHTEQQILSSLAQLRQGRTTIIVSHRQQILKLADNVLVIKLDNSHQDGESGATYSNATSA